MVVNTVYVRVHEEAVQVDNTITPATYPTTQGVYGCFDIGGISGTKLKRNDIEKILQHERSAWTINQGSRATALYWNSQEKRLCVNILGWASKKYTEVQTDGSTYVEGITLMDCKLSKTEITGQDKLGIIQNDEGEDVFVYGTKNYSALNVCNHDNPTDSGDGHVTKTNSQLGETIKFFKTGQHVYGISNMNFVTSGTSADPVNVSNNEIEYIPVAGQSFFIRVARPNRTLLDPKPVAIDEFYVKVTTRNVISGATVGNVNYNGQICFIVDGQMIASFISNKITPSNLFKIPTTSFVKNTGQDDVFGLISNGYSCPFTFWIPTLQGESFTSAGTGAKLYTSVANTSNQVYKFNNPATNALSKVCTGSCILLGTDELNDVFVSENKHYVCMIVQTANVDGGDKIKYSWTSKPIKIKLKAADVDRDQVFSHFSNLAFVSKKSFSGNVYSGMYMCSNLEEIFKDFNVDVSTGVYRNNDDYEPDTEPRQKNNSEVARWSTEDNQWYSDALHESNKMVIAKLGASKVNFIPTDYNSIIRNVEVTTPRAQNDHDYYLYCYGGWGRYIHHNALYPSKG